MRVHSEEIQCCIFPLQFKDYLCDDALIVEVWGRQKVKKNQMGALNTKELMVRERTGIQSSSVVCVFFFSIEQSTFDAFDATCIIFGTFFYQSLLLENYYAMFTETR